MVPGPSEGKLLKCPLSVTYEKGCHDIKHGNTQHNDNQYKILSITTLSMTTYSVLKFH